VHFYEQHFSLENVKCFSVWRLHDRIYFEEQVTLYFDRPF